MLLEHYRPTHRRRLRRPPQGKPVRRLLRIASPSSGRPNRIPTLKHGRRGCVTLSSVAPTVKRSPS